MSSDDDEPVASTDLFVTVNTHQQYTDQLVNELFDCIARLGNLQAAQEVFSSVRLTESIVRPAEVGIELSAKQRHVHGHFMLELTHAEETPMSLGGRTDADGEGVNRRLQRYFDDCLRLDGCYVRAVLARQQSAAKNYNRKQQREQHFAEGRLLDQRRFDFTN